MENYMEIPQKLKLELPYDPSIPLLGTYPKEMRSEFNRDTTPTFTVAVFTVAKVWNHPRCPPKMNG
jgi:hypothetical protein